MELITKYAYEINLVVYFTSFLGYVTYILIKYGILQSISDSWYKLPQNKKYHFAFFCLFTSFSALNLSTLIPDPFLGSPVFILIAAIGVLLVGAAPMFREEDVGKVHMTGAGMAISGSWLSMLLDNNFKFWWLALIILGVYGLLMIIKKNKFWWIECVALLTMGLLFVYYLNV